MKTPLQLPVFLRSEPALRAVQLCAGAIAIGLVFWQLQFSTNAICCGDFDGYYHFKWSQMLWQSLRSHSFPPLFIWLPLTTLDAGSFVDHHLLFHFFQVPFTWSGNLRLGAKISATIFASVAVFSCYWLLIRYHIRYALVWLLALLACSAPFLYRMNMAKAPPFAIIYLIVAIHLLFRKKYWPLLPLAFVFGLTYDMFVLLILATVLWTIVIGWTERRLEWRPLVWVLAGTSAGLIVNPYFPRNLHLLYEHLKIKLTPSDFSTSVGKEWYPYDSWEFLGNSVVACVAMVVGYISFEPADRKRSARSLFFLLFSTALMVMNMRWKRIAEYWPPFAIIFAAFALQPWLEGTRSALTRLSSDMLDELQPFLDRPGTASPTKEAELRELWRTIGVAVVAVVLAVALFLNIRVTMKDIATSDPDSFYKAGTEWLQKNVPANQIVFNTDWDDFPRLFYYDPTHRYVTGLDPTYLYDRDPALSKLYDRITLGKEEDPGPLIRDRFGARYVFSDNSHDDFFDNAKASGWFDVVYEDSDCTIMHIRDEKAEPLPEDSESDQGSDEETTDNSNQ
ncbi:MAG TPA: hypothetical protein VE056_05135 [Pyrinomonadaceae bacterium]|nr:hypothetical protein [Pyrinomonadaceae bacterium]